MKNVYPVTWPLYRSWSVEGMFRGARLALLLAWSALGVITLAIFLGGGSVLYLLLALFCVYRAFLRPFVLARNMYRTMEKVYGGADWPRTISFDEDGILVEEQNTSARYAYGDITDIREKGDEIRIFFRNKTSLRLYRSAFVDTNWDRCRAFIREHQAQQAD